MSEPNNIAELRHRIAEGLEWTRGFVNSVVPNLLARSERLERAVELLREIGPLHPWLTQRVAALLAEHDAAKESKP